MKGRLYAALVVLAIFTAQCDRSRPELENSTTPVVEPEPSKVQLILFGKSNCVPCKKELEEVPSTLRSQFSSKLDRIHPSAYFIRGPNKKKASQADADKFAKDSGWPYKMIADPQLEMYRRFFKEGEDTPKTVIIGEKGEVLKTYLERIEMSVLIADLNEVLQ